MPLLDFDWLRATPRWRHRVNINLKSHLSQDIGPDPIKVQFTFKVRDKTGKESKPNFFTILGTGYLIKNILILNFQSEEGTTNVNNIWVGWYVGPRF